MSYDDPYTSEHRLCNDDGLVQGEYLDLLNRLLKMTREARGDKHEPVTDPFLCTGHAHLAGEHIFCTSSAHGPYEWRALDCGSATSHPTLVQALAKSPAVMPLRLHAWMTFPSTVSSSTMASYTVPSAT